MSKVSVLFVCMGNICRSPTAHGVFEHMANKAGLASKINVDSAGTHSHHNGEKPDPRSVEVAKKHGYDLTYIRSRKVLSRDFEDYDYIIAMDSDNLMDLKAKSSAAYHHKIHLLLDISKLTAVKGHADVPDPYYGGAKGFNYVFELAEEGSKGLLDHINQQHF